MKYLIRFTALTLLAALLACSTYVKVRPIATTAYPPTTACEVFTTTTPDKPYIELAMIEVYQGGNSIEIAKKKAMGLGADAIILTGRANYGAVAVAPGIVGAAEKMIFVAVKYK